MTTQGIDPGIFTGGQYSQLPVFPSSSFSGTELFALAIARVANYSITSEKLGTLLAPFVGPASYVNTIITSGATLGTPYTVPVTVTRALFNKTVGAATGVLFGLSGIYTQPILIRDLKGDADVNNITINFSGGQLCDGLDTLTIANPYGGYVLNPLSSGWYLGFF